MKPTTTATTRVAVMRSPSNGQARNTTTSGAMKLIEIASATPTDLTAEKKSKVDSSIMTEFTSCKPIWRVRNSPSPMRGMKTSATSTRWMTMRNQTISRGS